MLLLAIAAEAGTVYRWRDASGAVHYSDEPPPPGAQSADQVELAPAPGATTADQDYYSVTNQARRMEEQRREAERQQAEIEAVRRRDAAAAPAADQASPRKEEGEPVWILAPGYGRPPHGPGHRPPTNDWWPQFPLRPPHRPAPRPDRPAVEPDKPTFRIGVQHR